MKLLNSKYNISDAGDREGNIYLTHYPTFDLITVIGEDFTILYHQIRVQDLSVSEKWRIGEMCDGAEIDELEVWYKCGDETGCVMIYHSNPDLCPDHRKVVNSYFNALKRYEPEPTKPKLKRYEINMGRTGYGNCTFYVEANSEAEAQEKAHEEAGDHLYSENDSDYEIIGMEEVK